MTDLPQNENRELHDLLIAISVVARHNRRHPGLGLVKYILRRPAQKTAVAASHDRDMTIMERRMSSVHAENSFFFRKEKEIKQVLNPHPFFILPGMKVVAGYNDFLERVVDPVQGFFLLGFLLI